MNSAKPLLASSSVADGYAAVLARAACAPGEPDGFDAIAPPSMDDALLQWVPSPLPLDFPQLVDDVRGQRRIFVHKEAAIPVAAVVSIGGALLFHAAIATLFVLCFLYLPRISSSGGDRKSGEPDTGGSSSSYMLLDEPPDTPTIPTDVVAEPPARTPVPAPVQSPPAAGPPPAPPQIASVAPAPSPDDPIIGLSAGRDPIAPRPPALPDPPPIPAPTVTGLPIVAPPQNALLAAPVVVPSHAASPPPGHGHPGPARLGPEDGDDPGDEEVIDLSAHGTGSGTGSGKHHGAGIDRGASGANSEARPLNVPILPLWADFAFHPPKKRVIAKVTVLADGSVGQVEITQSCGVPEIDRAYVAMLRYKCEFHPAYREGKAVDGAVEVSQSFGTDDE